MIDQEGIIWIYKTKTGGNGEYNTLAVDKRPPIEE